MIVNVNLTILLTLSLLSFISTPTENVMIKDICYNPPGDDVSNLNGEWVELINIGNEPVNLRGMVLMDANNHEYVIPMFVLEPGSSVKIHSGKGVNNETDLYWGRNSSVWNNDGDAVKLMYGGEIIDELDYGNAIKTTNKIMGSWSTRGLYLWGVSLSTIVLVGVMLITTLLRLRGNREDEVDWDEFIKKGTK